MDQTADQNRGDGSTLTEVLEAYSNGGFGSSFTVLEDGCIECLTCHSTHDASRLKMSSLRRLEGESDPSDMMAIVALTCPSCDAQGTIVLGYGPTASAEDADVLLRLQDFRHDGAAPGNSAPGEAAGDLPAERDPAVKER